MKTIGMILIGAGIIALIYTGINYTTTEKVVNIGSLEIDKQKEHSIDWSPLFGVILILGGIVVMVIDKRKMSA